YTGVRIAMTIAKTIAEVAKLKLFTISTLRLYSNGEKNTMVIMDARASRAYVGIYDNGNTVMKDQVMNLKDINSEDYNVVGDGSLIGKEDKMYTISGAFLNTMNFWEEVKEIDFLVPEYLKESDSYYR
ncbi:MAG: tRNA (adenosine(37)-N6)-threonylcarbamoyltransferase complex dimerization subunit type 1 TsaB, partial [Erysipelotrichaceae bacterium]